MKVNFEVKRILFWHKWFIKLDGDIACYGLTITTGKAYESINNTMQAMYYMKELVRD